MSSIRTLATDRGAGDGDPLERSGFATLPIEAQYRTGDLDPVANFYRPCLAIAERYDRAVGYFRSSIYSIVGPDFVTFARRGGQARLVCSPSLTAADTEAMALGYAERHQVISTALARDLDAMLADGTMAYQTRVLATLIKFRVLDVRVAVRTSGNGIYHEKTGVFQDAHKQRVSFLGSANETWSAWHHDGNHESIEVFREWANEVEALRVASHAANFERLWEGTVSGVETIPFPEALRDRLISVSAPSIDELATKRPSGRRALMPHQVSAIDAWERAGRRGIFEHATGSGKTFTALGAVKRHIADGARAAIILVPSKLLHEQWRREIELELPDAAILLAGSGHARWKRGHSLRAHTTPELNEPRIVLATMQTAASQDFLTRVSGGSSLLLVADEVHQIGSRFNSRAMSIVSGASLGLSATPRRYGDLEGTARIFERFGDIIDPKITLEDAIRSGRLVNYEYHPHPVHLDEDEADEWTALTRKISLEVARGAPDANGARQLSDFAKMLLIQRSRIAKKARVKPGLAAASVAEAFEDGQSWLVYCEDATQLRETMARLSELGIRSMEYHSGMRGDRDATLLYFREFGGVLVSIKCLDEGVDIPAVTHAFILASSQNPRQFIQRRGRVLRKSPGKDLAVIHDAIVVPVASAGQTDQASLLRAELARAIQFADSAMNRSAGAQLRSIAIDMGIEIDETADTGTEEEEEEPS